MADHTSHGSGDNPQTGQGGLAMMVLMMACCLGVILLFALIPLVGWPIGLTIGAVGLVAMLVAHQRWMGHGSHH